MTTHTLPAYAILAQFLPLLLSPLVGLLLAAALPPAAQPGQRRLALVAALGGAAAVGLSAALSAPLPAGGAAAELWLAAGLGWCLLALALWDLRCGLLPDRLTLPLLLAGLAATALLLPERLPAHALGAAAGFLALAGLRALYRGLRGREGLGLGDAKLLAAGGAWLGWEGLASVVLWACVGAFLLVAAQRLAGRRPGWQSELAFGPWLALGIWLVWLLGPLTLVGPSALE